MPVPPAGGERSADRFGRPSMAHAATSLRGRPRGRLRAITTPRSKISPPQTPQGSARSRAPARQAARIGQPAQKLLASSRCAGLSANHSSGSSTRHGSGRRTGAGDTETLERLGVEPPVRGSPVRRGGGVRSMVCCPAALLLVLVAPAGGARRPVVGAGYRGHEKGRGSRV